MKELQQEGALLRVQGVETSTDVYVEFYSGFYRENISSGGEATIS